MFIPISENLSAGWKNIRAAIEKKDADHIRAVARESAAGGAAAINVSGSCDPENELENLLWLMEVAAGAADAALCIDTMDADVLSGALARHRELRGPGGAGPVGIPGVIVNSITGEKKRYAEVLPLVKEYGAGVIALGIEDAGMPRGVKERVRACGALAERLLADGVDPRGIFLDVLIMPAGVDAANGPAALETARGLRHIFPDIHLTCGLSNVSHGLPGRRELNTAFLPMLVEAGVDSAIMDTSDLRLMGTLRAALALAGKDPFCSGYLAARRKKGIDV